MHNEGYTLLEMLLCLMVSTMMIGLSIPCILKDVLSDELILSQYNFMHTKSMMEHKTIQLNDIHPMFNGSGLYFNDVGSINQATSLSYKNKHYIIRLGFGNLRVE